MSVRVLFAYNATNDMRAVRKFIEKKLTIFDKEVALNFIQGGLLLLGMSPQNAKSVRVECLRNYLYTKVRGWYVGHPLA